MDSKIDWRVIRDVAAEITDQELRRAQGIRFDGETIDNFGEQDPPKPVHTPTDDFANLGFDEF